MYNNGSTTMPIEAKENDLLESDRLKAVTNLQKYQDETRSWRDLKVKKREFDVDNLVLLQSPQTESSDKLELKWDGPYVVIKKTRPGAYRLEDPQVLVEHRQFMSLLCLTFYKNGGLVNYK
jgi:hypothetical protein